MDMWVIRRHLDGDGKRRGEVIELSISCCIQLIPCYGARIPSTMTDSHAGSHLGSHLSVYLDQIPSNFQNASWKLKLKMHKQIPGRFASGSRQRSGPSIETQPLLAVAAQERTLNNEAPFYRNPGSGLAANCLFLGSCWRNVVLCNGH